MVQKLEKQTITQTHLKTVKVIYVQENSYYEKI
jgi:hypothetical protein